jgi:hypothetical protein
MLLIYTVFVAAWLSRDRLQAIARRKSMPKWAHALLVTLFVGALTESLAWASNFLALEPQPALLHPQLAYDLLLSPGIYAAWALAWIGAGRLFTYSTLNVFVLQGVYGVFIEQQGAVFLDGAATLPAGAVLWLYVFVVYGSAMGLAVLLWPPGLLAEGRSRRWFRFPLAVALNFACTAITALAWAFLVQPLRIPAPRPIWEAPLW